MKILYLLALVLVAGCTTTRPLTAREVEQAKRDTLLMKQNVVNQPVRIVEVPTILRDTVVIERTTHTQTQVAVTDTTLLAQYLERYHSGQSLELEDLRQTILQLEGLLQRSRSGTDTLRSRLQLQIDTTKKREKAAQEVLATTYKIVQVPIYIYLVLLGVVIALLIVYGILKGKLRRRQQSQT